MGVGWISLKSYLRETKGAGMVSLKIAVTPLPQTPEHVWSSATCPWWVHPRPGYYFCLGAGRVSSEKVLKLCCMAASPEIPGPSWGPSETKGTSPVFSCSQDDLENLRVYLPVSVILNSPSLMSCSSFQFNVLGYQNGKNLGGFCM